MSSHALTVLFADLAGSTRLFQEVGDTAAHQRVTDSLQCMKSAIENNQGELLRTVGDAALASFADTWLAYVAAVDIQSAHQASQLSVRVGFHHGNVIPDDGDVYGNAVNIAARVASFAEADEICITDDAVARLTVPQRANVQFMDRVDFKGIAEPMAVYRINWREDTEQTAIVSAESSTERYTTNMVLDLLIGAKRIRIDRENPVVSFGRAFDNNVIIDTESASRNHARIELTRGRYLFHDSSTNGTYIKRGGYSTEFIRRETTSLNHFGSIGLGFSPDTPSPHIIEYRMTTYS